MIVYHVYSEGFNDCTFANKQKALAEVDELIKHSDEDDVICIKTGEMTQKEYNALGEFQGY